MGLKDFALTKGRPQSSPFFLSQPANDAGAREGTGVRCDIPFSPVPFPHGCACHTSRLPRTGAVRWLGEKKGTLQSRRRANTRNVYGGAFLKGTSAGRGTFRHTMEKDRRKIGIFPSYDEKYLGPLKYPAV